MDLIVYDNIGINEIFGDGNIFTNENIIINENVTISSYEDFSLFLRSYPYIEIIQCDIDTVDLGGGYTQIIDRWGRNKKEFQINFPVMTKAEFDPIVQFYLRNYKNTFYFTEPLDSIRYIVRFKENSFKRERSHFDTYFGAVNLIEEI